LPADYARILRLKNPFAAIIPNLYELRGYLAAHRRAYWLGILCILATNAFGLAIPWVMRGAFDRLEKGAAGPGAMLPYVTRLVLLAAASGIFLYLMRKIVIGASRQVEYRLRSDFLGRLQTLSLSFFQRQRTGDLMARASNDLNAVRDVLGPGIMYALNTVTTVVASLVLMIRLDPLLALYTLLPFPIITFLIRNFSMEMHRRSRVVQDQYGTLSSTLQEDLAGIRVIQSYAQEPYEARHFEAMSREYMYLGMRLIRYRALVFGTMGSLIGLLTLILLWLGGIRVIRESIGLGEFVAFMGYLGILTWPFIALGWVLGMVQRGEAAMARILEIWRELPEIADPQAPTVVQPHDMKGRIIFDHVCFRYGATGEDPDVLKGISEAIEPGATVAIIGRTGSGKSTLVSLIPRLYDPTEGAVRLDGVDVRNLPLSFLRSSIGVVPQESFLFSDTLRANLRFGKPDASDADLMRALDLARFLSDLEGFPRGLDTLIGERGLTLSGGQRQRVSFARAILADPAVLILDDAFSSVDKLTESELLDSLDSIRSGRTTILIAHRISTVRTADRILVLHQGAIAESGTHEELLRLRGLYAGMERRQRLAEEIEHVGA
jgi:ATP-binding cassette, subfamily B, multidrug efflux pump